MTETFLTWQAHEYEHKERSTDWFWAVGVITIGIAIISIILGNILLAMVIIIGMGAVMLHNLRKPRLVTFRITERGVEIGTTLYLYSELEAFWIRDEKIPNMLLIKSKKVIMPLISIPLSDVRSDEVHEVLSHYLDEEEMHESYMDVLVEWFGF